MGTCSYISRKGAACQHPALHNGRYCWRHTPGLALVYLASALILIGGAAAAWAVAPYLRQLNAAPDASIIEQEAAFTELFQQAAEAQQRGDYAAALGYYEQALTISRKIRSSEWESDILGYMGWTYEDMEQPERALEVFNQAQRLARKNGDRANEVLMLNAQGVVHQGMGQLDQARECYNQSLAIAQKIDNQVLEQAARDLLQTLEK